MGSPEEPDRDRNVRGDEAREGDDEGEREHEIAHGNPGGPMSKRCAVPITGVRHELLRFGSGARGLTVAMRLNGHGFFDRLDVTA